MTRELGWAALVLALAACAKSEPPVGVSTAPYDETGRSEPAPTGGAGYEFGSTPETVQKRCAGGGGAWKHHDPLSSCTVRNETAGATRVTLLEWCDGKLCRVHTLAVLDRTDAATWLGALELLRRELTRTFGAPDEQETHFPAECEREFSKCVRDGSATAVYRWSWPDGHAVLLRLGAMGDVPATISVSYANPAGNPSE
jgi:hypothetical protein